MDRIWTKRSKKNTLARKKEPTGARSTAHLRWITAGALLLSIVSLVFLTSGPASLRMLQFAMPLIREIPGDGTGHGGFGVSPVMISRVDVDPGVGEEIRIEVLSPQRPFITELGGNAPRVLIYHTHATEAYTMTDGYQYEESGSDQRTEDPAKSIVAVGALLADTLRKEYGFNVIHDTTNHEPPLLRTSYSRSLETMLRYKEQYPSLTMFIDVHRDSGNTPTYAVIDGKEVARMMFVVGTGEGVTGTGFSEMPDFESNYALAYALTEKLLTVDDNLMRNIRVKTDRYNQHVSSQCLLVEIGHNGNTFEQALNTVPHLAQAIHDVMFENPGNAKAAAAAAATERPLPFTPAE